jgi:Autographiviridae endonuclease VII
MREVSETRKTCRRCSRDLPISSFNCLSRAGDGHASRCRECTSKGVREWKDRRKAEGNPWSIGPQLRRKHWLNRSHGITPAQFNQMLVEQGGGCALCCEPESIAHQSGTIKELSVDHCHDTDRIRGLLCSKCNQGLGLFKDDPTLLRRAADYIERHVSTAMLVA